MHAHQFRWAWLLLFRRYGYLSKTAKFPFWGMDYSPWSSKNLIDRNWLKKFMQVGIDVKCMHTNLDGCGFFGFGDMATFQKRPNFPFGAWSPCPEREIWPFLKGSHISETKEATPIQIGVHALDINPYLHEFFEPIPID